jgi:NADPH2:quinone reductase
MTAPPTIGAAVLRICGQPPAIEERPAPAPGEDDLTVAVTAAPITPLDLLCASGTSYFGTPATPYVPGVQGVGRLGDDSPVWFATPAGMRAGDGSMAARVVVSPGDVVRLPEGVPLELIAALGLSAVAARQALRAGGLTPGAHVVVLGAGGVVGQSAVQLAKLGGAARVTAVARSSDALDRARALGADAAVQLLPGDDPAALAARLSSVAGSLVDVVLDPVFGVPAAAALRVLRPGGRLVNIGSSAAATAPIDSATLRRGSLQVIGYTNNSLTPAERADALIAVAGHAAAGALTVDHEVVPFGSVSDAWSRQAAGATTGRIVLAF